MPNNPVVIDTPDPQPQIRVTRQANAHMVRVLRKRRKMGLVVTKTQLASEALLAIPIIPNGAHPVPAPDVKKINQEAIS